jgi:hypothetical protein
MLAAKPKLRQRVEEMLTGILETAEELRRTGQGVGSGSSWSSLLLARTYLASREDE